MSPGKQRRRSAPAPAPEATLAARTLPSDLVLEIVARSDAATLVRCAACCNALRRDILSPAFIRRVCHGPCAVVPPRLLGFLPCYCKYRRANSRGFPPPAAFSLAHPATPAAARLSDEHLGPFLSRAGADLLACSYYPLTSRNGLIVLRRRYTNTPQDLESGICVYDPMAGDHTFVPGPAPEMGGSSKPVDVVLLTSLDGIGCSFILLKVDFTGLVRNPAYIEVQTVSSDAATGGKWSPVTSVPCRRSYASYLHPSSSAVVLNGSIHWLTYSYDGWKFMYVLTYNLAAATVGRIDLPMDRLPESYTKHGDDDIRLGSTADEKLAMIFREELKISIWLLSADAGWGPHAVVDTEKPLRSLVPEVVQPSWPDTWINFESSWSWSWESSGVLLFSVVEEGNGLQGLVVLDIKTKEMHRVHDGIHVDAIPFEVDLESRLSAMKAF